MARKKNDKSSIVTHALSDPAHQRLLKAHYGRPGRKKRRVKNRYTASYSKPSPVKSKPRHNSGKVSLLKKVKDVFIRALQLLSRGIKRAAVKISDTAVTMSDAITESIRR